MSRAVDALVVLGACWGLAAYFIARSRRAVKRAEWGLIDDRRRANEALRGCPLRDTSRAASRLGRHANAG